MRVMRSSITGSMYCPWGRWTDARFAQQTAACYTPFLRVYEGGQVSDKNEGGKH